MYNYFSYIVFTVYLCFIQCKMFVLSDDKNYVVRVTQTILFSTVNPNIF